MKKGWTTKGEKRKRKMTKRERTEEETGIERKGRKRKNGRQDGTWAKERGTKTEEASEACGEWGAG